MRALLQVMAGLMVLGALGHLAAAPFAYEGVSQEAMWFVGTGLFLCLVGAASLVASGREETPPGTLWLALGSNAVSGVFMAVLFTATGASQPIIFLLLNVLQIAALGGMLSRRPLQFTPPEAR